MGNSVLSGLNQKLLGISNFGIETLQVYILGIANQLE